MEVSFVEFRDKLINHFNDLSKNVDHLFEVQLDKDELWNLYLDSFPDGTNNIYRERRKYDCSCCRHFIKTIGNVVFIVNNKIHTIWEFDTNSTTFQPVVDALDSFVKSNVVNDVYVTKDSFIGTKENHEKLENGTVQKWSHFYLNLPNKFLYRGRDTIDTVKSEHRAVKNVFKRSLEEITDDSVETVLELISQDSLYRGKEWESQLKKFLELKKEYSNLSEEDKDNYIWVKSLEVGAVIGKIRNHSIGILLVNISEDMDLDTAVRKYEQIVAPSNYKRPKAIFTKKMLEDAKKTISELGYMESLPRRFATIDDITVNNILFANRNVVSNITSSDIFSEMGKEVAVNPKKFSKVEEISIDKFVNDVLPNTQSLEVLFENRHSNNLVSLIAPQNKDAKTMFKWDNQFGWAYTGGLADSMKERVKAAGGKVDGDLRFSIQWNENGKDDCDLDAHCKEASGYEIYFGYARKPSFSPTKGQLDVDIIQPRGEIAIENITWADRKTMVPGKYLFFVNQFSGSAKNGFRAEIEFDGQVYSFDYNKRMRSGENVNVAEVTLNTDGTFTIKELLPSNVSSRDVWGLKTNQFAPVTVVMNSPNYWDDQKGVGNKHLFFMLKDCINPEQPRGFFNEFLKDELNKHKRVLESLGDKLSVVDADHQLSGIGFSTTQRNELIVKVTGKTQRVLKIKF